MPIDHDVAPPAHEVPSESELSALRAEVADLRRRTTLARRRQLVALMPVHGRVARGAWWAERIRHRLRPAPVASAETREGGPIDVPELSPEWARLREAAMLRGDLAEVGAELAKAELDLATSAVDRLAAVTKPWRLAARGLFRSLPRRLRRPTAPAVSVITTVYDPPPALLRACLRSVSSQTFGDVEHVLVDDASPGRTTRSLLRRAIMWDRRRVVVRLADNGGIVAAGNAALAAARGAVVVFLDHDDVLTPDAVERLAAPFRQADPPVLVYGDHDILTPDGRAISPFYKPDFSPERLRSQNYITHPMAVSRATVEELGGLTVGFDGAQDHDLVLRLGEAGRVAHVPGVLYHWRQAPQSVALAPSTKPYAFEAGRRAVAEHCRRIGVDAEVEHGSGEGHYVVRRRLQQRPLVSIVVPTRGTASAWAGEYEYLVVAAVASIVEHSTYDNVEFVVVADAHSPPEALERVRALAPDRVRVVPWEAEFNFSAKCNLGVHEARGEVILLLNDDTRLIEPDSLEVMLAHLEAPDVGMVGAKLLFGDGRLQHGGHVYTGQTEHALRGWMADRPGPWRMLAVERECSGVTAAAAMIRTELFHSVGGLDPMLPSNFNDVDLSLRVRELGYRILWTPRASWYHYESLTRSPQATAEEAALLTSRWGPQLQSDPYFNPCLQPLRDDWVPRPLRGGVAPDAYRWP